MINKKYEDLGKNSSCIRELFEYGKKRKAEVGDENVYDFSLGNPSVPAPKIVKEVMSDYISNADPVALHGYTSAPGDLSVRQAIADHITKNSNVESKASLIYMTCGAAASLTISLCALTNAGDEVVVFAPFFPEYNVFIKNANAVPVICKCKEPDFSIDFCELKNCISEKTSAVIINSPNNPTGSVITEDEMQQLADFLEVKQKEYGHPIYLISDEPYRELVYGNVTVPYPSVYYKNTITCYSFSKSLSLPGERIGYIEVCSKAEYCNDIFAAICGAGRSLGFVCAPSLLQYTVAKCLGKTSDVSVYESNRTILSDSLKNIGYEVVEPKGAFYLFVKALCEDANEFSEQAKKHDLLLVPSDSFGVKGYVRISYCVSETTVKNSIPAFEQLFNDYKVKN